MPAKRPDPNSPSLFDVCERCGSDRLHEFSKGDFECQACGYIVYADDHTEEDDASTND